MGIFYPRRRGGKHLKRSPRAQNSQGARLAALLLCLSMLTGVLPSPASAEDTGKKLSDIVHFDSIALHYAGPDGHPAGETLKDGVLLEKDKQLVLRYTYQITEEQCKKIKAGINYYLEISPHLVVNDLEDGSDLTIKTGDELVPFGKIYAEDNKAWVTFSAKENGTDTVLSKYGELNDAYFYLDCNRAADVPEGENPIEGQSNLYAMKFENNTQLNFGYAENEPVSAKAQITKGGSLTDKTITWTIDYTPWQNPTAEDGVALDTPFELRDTIDTSLHSYVDGSAKIGNAEIPTYTRDTIPENAEAYLLAEDSENNKKVLIFGGTKLSAGEATKGNPATPLAITYKTEIKDELLLPGGTGGKSVTNAADLFAGENGVFNSLNISSSKSITIPQPTWLEKTGTTTRHTDGTGSTTAWTVTFHPNGFTDFTELTLHDQLPDGSTLVPDSVKVGGTKVAETLGTNNDFTISPITTDNQPISITYQSHVPEEMYDSGTSLGCNIAWFTFQYGGQDYTTPQVKKDVGSGDGTGTPGTSILVKTNEGYNAADRTIKWAVKINPHKANLKSGTFIDDLSILGPACNVSGHTRGLEVVGDISVLVGDSTLADESKVKVTYSNQKITVETKEVGYQTITLTYTTKVCDPCVFVNNTTNVPFKNTISTENMVIGSSTTERSASADSTASVGATVLTKKAPVYDYASGTMKWTVEVDAAGLSMTDVVLTDELPDGLTYKGNSFKTVPEISGASASMDDQTLTINLGAVTGITTVTFDTEVNPEALGFGGDKPVVVNNTIHMNGKADGVEFAEVSHSVEQSFANHGLVKGSSVNNKDELIAYEVLINPFGLALPENPSLVGTLDKRLQLDTDTLKFYKAALSGTTLISGQKPGYTKVGDGQPLKITSFDPDTNSFTAQLPIGKDSRDAYVLAYTADIIRREADGYSNSVRFDGGSVLLGGSKNNSASVGGGGGGGGGGAAARKAKISIVKTDSETKAPLPGVSFTLYQWDSDQDTRGLPFAQGETDSQGKLSFLVKPGAVYELVETRSAPGYGTAMGWEDLPDGAAETGGGLLITAGAAASERKLALTNDAHTADLVFRLVNESGIPMAGTMVRLFRDNPDETQTPAPYREVEAGADGTVRFPGLRRGARYFVQRPGGGIMTIEIPAQTDQAPTVELPDGTSEALTPDYLMQGSTPPEEQWTLTVKKVISGSETPLAGAAIGLYADAACQDLIKTAVSDGNGSILFSGLIKGQGYWLREITAPPDYQLNSAVYTADEANATAVIENTPKEPPVSPDEPAEPDTPGEPDIPGGSGGSIRPGRPGRPGSPGETGISGESGIPGGTGIPDEPAPSGEDGTPDEPGASDENDTPGESGEDDTSGSLTGGDTDASTDAPHIPQTGDFMGSLALVTLLSGTLLAAMAVYELFVSKKREKK